MSSKKSTGSPTGSTAKNSKSSANKKNFTVSFYHDWCKQCGLCVAFCPKKIIKALRNGKPEVIDEKRCTGCRFCEMHCPDFAITVEEKTPKRRKTDE